MKPRPRIDGKAARGGRGFGALDKAARAFLTPDFDKNRQVGETAVGGLAVAERSGVAPDIALEGSDVE